MKNNGLLTCEQLDVIFQNLEELIDVNKQFTDRLQQTVEAAIVAGDEVKGVGFTLVENKNTPKKYLSVNMYFNAKIRIRGVYGCGQKYLNL